MEVDPALDGPVPGPSSEPMDVALVQEQQQHVPPPAAAASAPPPLPPPPAAPLPRYLDHHPMAPVHPIPQIPLLSIEYPGFITPDPSSLQRALWTLGGPPRLETLLEHDPTRPKEGNSAALPIVELNYGRTHEDRAVQEASRWRHPVLGQVVQADKVALKVRKRRKVRVHEDGTRERLEAGEYTMEMLGGVAETVRFRNIADHQLLPPEETEGARHLAAMRALDHTFLAHDTMPEETEEYMVPAFPPLSDAEIQALLGPAEMEVDDEAESALDPSLSTQDKGKGRGVEGDEEGGGGVKMKSVAGIYPPPMFSMQRVPWSYNFRANPYSLLVAIEGDSDGAMGQLDDGEGVEQMRLSNKSRNQIIGVGMVKFHPGATAPVEPPNGWSQKASDGVFLGRLQMLFADPGTYPGIQSRPVWSRIALANQFSEGEQSVRHRMKMLLPGVAYTFEGGAYRDLMIRLGYDPRFDSENGPKYQGARLRVLASAAATQDRAKRSFLGSHNARHYTSSLAGQKMNDVLPGGDPRKTHLFDGKKLHRDWQNFQLCDISEPELVDIIEDRDGMRDKCFGEDGWFKPIRYTLIRELLRRKFNHLLQYGRPLPDGECDELKRAAEDEQLEVDGRLGERSSGEEDGAWADLGEEDNAADKGKGKNVAKGKRKAKRKSLSALLTSNSGSRSKAVRRARQVGVSDALELAERLERDLAQEQRGAKA